MMNKIFSYHICRNDHYRTRFDRGVSRAGKWFPYVSVFRGLRSTAWDCERTACKRT